MENSLPAIPPKRYFTIGEVSELCGVKPYVLRYWEQEFTQLRPMKRRGNRRYYQHHEVLLIRRIRDLLYEQGFTISGARNRLTELGPAALQEGALEWAGSDAGESAGDEPGFELPSPEVIEVGVLPRATGPRPSVTHCGNGSAALAHHPNEATLTIAPARSLREELLSIRALLDSEL
ncbi:MAG TPA: MerR family transcriptional regulator [Burkholderiaceae bacterium]|nr:MerR family transcriptional regulator [Burkholderiaceae bacterium]HMX10979.1 MerR family transcriptional regulator [Burkholderiaceae bacterium]HMY98991.1 MerR family transcriptional regulator [Burkholderiaceae bacterium]HNB43097.1 MerR family transcriptional regulator [Burkholderiaceae bacterium]HNG78323.1 MerR family transcriptional regulator [Burkholderiaceae bacterium]